MYGVHTRYVTPVQAPDASDTDFHWAEGFLSDDNKPLKPQSTFLYPEPITSDPPFGFAWPLAPTYTLNSFVDHRYAYGWYYSTPIHVSDKAALHARLLKTATPPGVAPIGYENGKHIMKPIEGMIRMPEGVPFVGFIDGDPLRPITIGCFHTLDSLRRHPNGAKIESVSDELWDWSYGTENRMPLYKLEGLKANYRSTATGGGSADGSYSIATTLGEGQGKGVAQPAVQANTAEAKDMFQGTLRCIHELYRLIVSLCISKVEWDILEFRDQDMNVFTLGGFAPSGVTSCQMNVVTAWLGGSLALFLGLLQGKWHVDMKDDLMRWTLLIVQIRIPQSISLFVSLFLLLFLIYVRAV